MTALAAPPVHFVQLSDACDDVEPDCARVRPLRKGESRPVVEVFDGLSEESRFRRFLTAMPRLPGAVRDALAAADGHHHVALVAEVGCAEPTPIGIARYVRTGPETAEVAVEVVDSWHRRGVGRALLRNLAEHARAAGVTALEGTALASNTAILNLLRTEAPPELEPAGDDVVSFTVPLRPRSTTP